MKPIKTGTLFVATLVLAACGTSFQEVHFYRVDTAPGKLSNYYRLLIKGNASFSKARYISGCYDERAVDLVFDEMKTEASGDLNPILSGGEIEVGGQKVATIPVGADSEVCPDGQSKIMVFSTNAKVVTDTIGEFAENQIVADAIVNLLQRDEIESVAKKATQMDLKSQQQAADSREIESLIAALPDGEEPDKAETQAAALQVLNAIARAQGRFAPIRKVDEAKGWFEAQQNAQEDVR